MSDVEGSTRKWELFGERMRSAMSRHDVLVAEAVSSCEGDLLKERGEGDSHFAVFKSASKAAECAIRIHRLLATENWGDLGEIKVRTALHTGDAELRDGDYYGPSVNRCARMRSAAHGGQIVLSRATQEQIKISFTESARLINLGEHRFRDLLEPEQVFQVVVEGLPRDFPPLNSIDPSRNNLPVQLTSFIGRERDLGELQRLIKKSRLVTLTGAGGCGKTRVSLQSAAELVNEMRDGVWFVELVGLKDGTLIPQTIAEVTHIALTGENPLDSLLGELKETHCLLVLDNCEHLVREVASIVVRILRECRNVKILATSRERLAVTGEHVFLIPPLECDLEGQEASLERVAKMDSVKLLCERAASRTADLFLSEASAASVAKLCKKLDGIPLAIEQAASNLPYLSPDQILDRLDRHLALLATDEEDIDPRHRTLTATIDWSYQMLSKKERLLFHRLPVFTGGWTLEAAEAICSIEGLARKEIFPLLQSLAGKSMVATELSSWGPRRYRLLEPIREYAIEKERPETELLQRHFEWHQHLAHEAYVHGLDIDNGRWLHTLLDEEDNIRSSLAWSLENSIPSFETLQASLWMHRFWMRQGYISEGLRWIEESLDKSPGAPEELQADALNVLGIFSWQIGRLAAAESAFLASLERSRKMGDEMKAAAPLNNLAGLKFGNRDFNEALNCFTQCIRTFRTHGDRSKLAAALENAGLTEEQLGNHNAAQRHLSEALAIREALPDYSATVKCAVSLLGSQFLFGFPLDNQLLERTCEMSSRLTDPFVLLSLSSLCAGVAAAFQDYQLTARLIGSMQDLTRSSEIRESFVQLELREKLLLEAGRRLGQRELGREVSKGRRIPAKQLIEQFRTLLISTSSKSE